jgi:hypothetical protein
VTDLTRTYIDPSSTTVAVDESLSSSGNAKGRPEQADDATLDEGCFYLSELGLSAKEVASRFEIDEREVLARRKRFEAGIKDGSIVEDLGREFWESIKEEAEGNIKVTFVSGKGFHHAWRTDLRKLDGPTLLSIFESCKDFLNLDPNARFLQYDAPKNYDPLAMQREISKAVIVVGALIEEKWKEAEMPKRKRGGAATGSKRRRGPDSPPNS